MFPIGRFLPLYGWRAALVTIVTEFLASYIVNLLPYSLLYRIYPHFRPRLWEKDGKIYQSVFRIRSWKEYIPAVGSFDKKHMNAHPDRSYLSMYLLESLRAELCHELAMVLGIAVMAISIQPAKWKILLWSLMLNLPCMMIQRFNRPRFERLLPQSAAGSRTLQRFWKESEIKEEDEV